MFSLDEDDEGEISVGESSDAEREMTPDIPKAPSVKSFDDGGDFEGASDVDQGTLRAFVVAVIYANAAVLLVALGPMVWFFEGWSRIGPALFVGGLLAGVRTYQTYRAWQRSRDEADEAAEGEADAEAAEGDENAETDGDAEPDEDDFDPDAAPPEA
ncbi:hypothetical protein C465_12873 [Halorubrum distributum JCM 9100]|uniref:DUF7322 domain-containing protein n=3 Tax=Halorubrum distributum TaxID=29283 RepID=M0EIM3_9EURY|nr:MULTISPECIES: hypothetical protein [Halorubrum distributum group]ELZ30775.1 hypothetical protein C473_12936 [Halorubrum terrestre JCM 10247]ELZ46269.1 hypothetical protein C465_12873 [Halorubrum distributum JCM 9100]ELZ50275.1 hypothetical protein C466_15167 [Halorubrum distributum JCM 10118]MDV7349821.1 hypothetical protein [Halorubrum distributum]